METFSAWLALYIGGIHRSPMDSPHKGQKRGAFDVLFDQRLNSKQTRRRWFETPSRSLWRHYNDRTDGINWRQLLLTVMKNANFCFSMSYEEYGFHNSNISIHKENINGGISVSAMNYYQKCHFFAWSVILKKGKLNKP